MNALSKLLTEELDPSAPYTEKIRIQNCHGINEFG